MYNDNENLKKEAENSAVAAPADRNIAHVKCEDKGATSIMPANICQSNLFDKNSGDFRGTLQLSTAEDGQCGDSAHL